MNAPMDGAGAGRFFNLQVAVLVTVTFMLGMSELG